MHLDALDALTHPWPLLVRMSIEGVPVRAIARIMQIPSEDIRLHLSSALKSGAIVQMPRDDWSPQLTRDKRVPEYARVGINEELLILNVMRLFGVTQQQACLLLMLIKRKEATRKMLHNEIEKRRPDPKEETQPKIIDVVICKVRTKLKPFGLFIKTAWSSGYYMPTDDRKKALQLLNEFLEEPNAVVAEEV